MSKKQIVIGLVLVVVLALIVVLGVSQKKSGPQVSSRPGGPTPQQTAPQPAPGYTPEVPKNAELTPPKLEAPASPNPEDPSKMVFYDLKATKNGFEPSTITVREGDSLRFDFTAVDGDYDLEIPYLGVYFFVVPKGVTRTLSTGTGPAGTYEFSCRDYCPEGKKITGKLIVVPRSAQ